MPKTTNAVPQACPKLEIQPGCTGTWYDISGETNLATLPMEVRATGSTPVFGDDTHVRTSGKKDPITATFTIVYTEEATEAWERLRAIWQSENCNAPLCVRVTPQGGNVGDLEIYIGDHTDPGLMTGLKPPDFSAGDGGPAVGEFQVFGNYVYDTKAS